MATDTQAQQNALREQRTDDLQAARASSNPAGRAHDLAQAERLRTEIQTNARANNQATAANTAASAASAAAATTATNTATTTAATDQLNGQNATNSIAATLNSLGLGGMTSWATNLAYTLAGQGISSADIVNTITGQMNNPTNADGSVNQDALNAFNAALPGFNQRITNTGNNGSPGSSPAEAIANYINYDTQIQQFQTQARLLPNTITAQDIGNLWAGDVSTSEVSQRITMATVAATSAPQQVQDYLASNFGMTPQALTSYYLNPTNTLQTLQTQTNTGMVGGEAAITGFDQNLSVAQASALGAFLANGASAGSSTQIGGVNAVTAGAANQAFNSNLGSNGIGGGIGSAAQLAAGGYEATLPGQSSTGTVSENTLLGALEGNATAVQETAQAEQARTAGSRGGGGAVTTASGSSGLGYAQQ